MKNIQSEDNYHLSLYLKPIVVLVYLSVSFRAITLKVNLYTAVNIVDPLWKNSPLIYRVPTKTLLSMFPYPNTNPMVVGMQNKYKKNLSYPDINTFTVSLTSIQSAVLNLTIIPMTQKSLKIIF